MKKMKIHRIVQLLTISIAITLLLASCGPSYVRMDGRRPNYGYGYGYGRPYQPYRYVVPPPRVVVVPRYSSPGRYRGDRYRHGGRRGSY
jgi:hypothetical protein